jgi:disease resistance protein RPM1
LGDDLRKHLAGEDPAFGKTRTSLAQCCDSLPDYRHKVCMLSVSAYPKGHRINRKSLIRRWIAEGLVVEDAQQKVACEYLDKLRDLSIIEPASPHGNYTKMKRCLVHGVMLEYLVQQSVSWNFITLVKEHEVVRNHETSCSARRLSVHGDAGEMDRRGIDLSRIRSLTVCNTNCRMSLESCKLLRVLDLEGCGWLSNDHLGVICGLLYLKYLSLRHTQVSELPRAIKDLQCLETLDVRQTQVAKLPLQVLKLPQLLHLFGKFELPHQLEDANTADKLANFFSEESKLQTLSGFKIVNNGGFEVLLLHLRMLRKVKIWCEVPPPSPPPPAAASWDRRIRNIFRKKKKI